MAKIQQGFVKLQKLLQVEPYKIVGLWSNGETRLNDFSGEVEKWQRGSNKELKKLANPRVFGTAIIKDGTLAFAGSTVRIPGISESQPVDFDRRKLYNDSEFIGRVVSPEDAIQHNQQLVARRKRQARSKTQAREDANSYIAKINFKPYIEQLNKQIGTKVTPLFIIGGELIELV